jgi:hypothetical protein
LRPQPLNLNGFNLLTTKENTMLKRLTRARRALVFAAVLSAPVLSGVFLTPRSVSSKLYYAKEYTYYSDASKSQVVGFGWEYCNGSSGLDGTSSPYRTVTVVDVCCGDVPC